MVVDLALNKPLDQGKSYYLVSPLWNSYYSIGLSLD